MKRRKFIEKVGAASAGIFTAPYILPSGRLFAATGARKANHVVFCLFAGGVRNLESIHKQDGNLMPNTLDGTESISPDISFGITSLPSLGNPTLQSQGTLYKEFRYASGPTGHFNGHTTAMTGSYTTTTLNLLQPPQAPTIFEYYRKHNSPNTSALNAWWVSNALGPYPSLNFSADANYGAIYGANYIQPGSLFSQEGVDVLSNPKQFTTTEKTSLSKLKNVLDKNFGSQTSIGDAGVTNTESDAILIENFIQDKYTNYLSLADPWGIGVQNMNNDLRNIQTAELILQEFEPELLVVNMQDVDVCHSNFTGYCDNLMKADYGLAHLWQTIQNTPGMANDTVLIAAPEHGRNLTENTIIDAYGRYANDHTGEDMSREIFCLVLGPSGVVVQNQTISTVTGQSVDIVPTIANVLGFDTDIPSNYLNGVIDGNMLNQAFL